MNDPPATWTDGPRDGRTHHLFIVAFSRFLSTHWPAEGGRRGEGWAATGLCPLTPAKDTACLPALPSQLPSCSTCHAVDGGAFLPPQTPCQPGSMFALSISLPNGTVPTSHSQAFCGTGHSVPLRGSVWGPLSSLFGDLWLALCLPRSGSKEPYPCPCPCPSGSQLGEMGASSLTPPPSAPFSS